MNLIIRFAFVFAVLFVPCYAQPSDSPPAADNLYAQALARAVEKFPTTFGVGDFLVEENYITRTMPTQIGTKTIQYLDWNVLAKRYKKLKKQFPILRVHPMYTQGDTVVVNFTLHLFDYKKRNWHFTVTEWAEVSFKFDCAKNEFVFDKIVHDGYKI